MLTRRTSRCPYTVLVIIAWLSLLAISAGLVTGAAGTAQPRGHLIIAVPADDPPDLDPGQRGSVPVITANVFETLVGMDASMQKVIPKLAESWKVINPTTWEFRLRRGVKFHNGEPFTAEAVKFTFERSRKLPAGTYIQTVDRVVIVDPYTVRVITKGPYPILERALIALSIVPPKYIAANGADALSKHPIGTGPFKFKERIRDNRTVLEVNRDYWGQPPAAETVTFRTIPDSTARIAALLAGEVNIITQLEPDQIPVVERRSGVRVASRRSPRRMYVFLRADRGGPLANKLVRQAINYAVDKETIISRVFSGRAHINATNLVPEEFGFDPTLKPYPYLPQYARRLLAQAGYPDGFSVTFETSVGRYLLDKEAAEAIAGYLEAVGIRVNLRVNEWGVHLGKYRTRTITDLFQMGYFIPTFDADTFMDFLHSKSDRSYLQNDKIDRLIDQARVNTDRRLRQQMYAQLQRIIKDEAPYLFLYQLEDIYGVSDKVTGFEPPMSTELFSISPVGLR